MTLNSYNIKRSLKRKLATIVLITASLVSFASLGDGGKKGHKLTTLPSYNSKNFSLRSGYNYRGNQLFSPVSANRLLMSNTFVSYQKGNATYILPLRKKIFSDKIKFNPAQPKF
ncbi:MAG TPA: hypothetical protein VGO09_05550 [Flavisolibacter sp.]|jgi:hypothetical protein|nr:hypothetical protein [Flavisolibacter sp.]